MSDQSLSNLIDLTSLDYFYSAEDSLFKRRLDKLNLKFYIETEKYLNNKEDIQNCQKELFIILFKQINLYIEEIERLNKVIQGTESINDQVISINTVY
jgi:hypothetical protein